MAIDSAISVARALVITMKGSAGLVAVVPAVRVFRQATPALPPFPFIRCGAAAAIPIRAACVDGAEYIVAVHGFAKDRTVGSQVVEYAEDYAGRLGAAIAAALDRQTVDIPNGTARITWTGSQLLMDPDESGAFHTVQNFRVRCLTA